MIFDVQIIAVLSTVVTGSATAALSIAAGSAQFVASWLASAGCSSVREASRSRSRLG